MEAEIIYGLIGLNICETTILIVLVVKHIRECKINRQLLNRTNYKG